MHAGRISLCRLSLHPLPLFVSSPASLHPSLHTCQAYSKVTHLNYPVRALHTHTQAHTRLHTCTKSMRGSVMGGKIRKEGARADFTLPWALASMHQCLTFYLWCAMFSTCPLLSPLSPSLCLGLRRPHQHNTYQMDMGLYKYTHLVLHDNTVTYSDYTCSFVSMSF